MHSREPIEKKGLVWSDYPKKGFDTSGKSGAMIDHPDILYTALAVAQSALRARACGGEADEGFRCVSAGGSYRTHSSSPVSVNRAKPKPCIAGSPASASGIPTPWKTSN